jgi:hypothetical protein
VASALDEEVRLDDLSGLLDQMLAESGGPPSPAECARRIALTDDIVDASLVLCARARGPHRDVRPR